MTKPVLYYLRHGETDWNAVQRLQGRRDIPLNARGRAQATSCGEILRDLFARDARASDSVRYLSSPLGRARETMELARTALGLDPAGYAVEPSLTEISFGEWEGSTIAELQRRDPAGVAARENDKYSFTPPGGENYDTVTRRMGDWFGGLDRDAVVVAHGGTARGLIAYLGIVSPEEAPLLDIEQGVVYVFADGGMTRYA